MFLSSFKNQKIMKKSIAKITLPQTKLREKTGGLKVTRSGYLLNKNGKVLPLKLQLDKK